jgi:hypothetical protein
MDGKLERIDIFNENWYRISEESYLPSVTFILNIITDKNLAFWFKQVGMNADIIVQRAKEIGSLFHNEIEILLKQGTIEYYLIPQAYRDIIWERIMNFEVFATKWLQGMEIIGIEKTVVNLDIGYAGTMDLITREPDGTLCIWDWKTGKEVHETNKCQIAAYAKCFAEPVTAYIVNFPEEPKTKQGFSVCTLIPNQIDEYFDLFLWHKKKFDREIKTPKIKSYPTKIDLTALLGIKNENKD